MGYYRGDYYRGDPGPLSTLLSRYGISGAEAERLPSGIVGKEDILRNMPQTSASRSSVAPGHVLGESAEEGYDRRRRRMNPLNPRALRRSMRRVQAFAKFASRTMSFTKRHKMKKRRRR